MLPATSLSTSTSDIIFHSREIIERFYLGMSTEIIPFLSQQIVWVDTTIPCSIHGYSRTCSFLQKNCETKTGGLFHLQYHLLRPQEEICVVTGKYRTMTKEQGTDRNSHVYLSSMFWQEISGRPCLFHIHTSSSVFTAAPARSLSFYGKHAELYRFLPEEILYIEAENINCVIHGTSSAFQISQPISQIEKQLPEQFLRVHRSFIINRNYVKRVYRYEVELSNRMTIPIPEKKYMSVVCEIERFAGS